MIFCVSTVSYSILLKGNLLPSFSPSHDLRQEDPLSFYFFILCSKILSNMILKQEIGGSIASVQILDNRPIISNLIYADDTFFFCKATLWEIYVL